MIGKVLIQIGPVSIYTHGFFLVLGVVLSSLCMYFLAKKRNLNRENLFDLISYTLIAGIIGARITYFILYHDQFSSFWDLFKIWQGGLVSWGGFILGVVVFAWALRLFKLPIKPWLDILAISSLLGLALGRLGSFLSGEIAGVSYSGVMSVKNLFPVTMAESAFDLLLFLILFFTFLRFKDKFVSGIFFFITLALYSLGRFCIDIFRAEDKMVSVFSLGQIFSLLVFVASLITVLMLTKRKGERNAR